MKWHKISGTQYTGEPFIKKVQVDGKSICLVGDKEQVFALSAKCPHAGEDLSRGWCEDGKLVCPYHRFSYSLETGRGSTGQNDYVDTFPVKIEAGEIYIGTMGFAEKIKGMFKFE